MAAQSLSPRPEMVMTMLWSLPMVGASFLAWATAWADSMAGLHGLVVGDGDVLGPADVIQVGVLRADAGVV